MSSASDGASPPLVGAEDPEAERRQVAIEKGWLLVGFGALATLPVFVANMILMPLKIETFLINPFLQVALATLVQVVLGYRFYRGAWLLVAGGTTAAYLYSLYLFVAYGEHYFESSMLILTLILLYKQLDLVAKGRTGAAVKVGKALSAALLAGAVAFLLWYTQPFTTVTYAMTVSGPAYNLGEIHVSAGHQLRFRIENSDPELLQMFGIRSIPGRFIRQVESTSVHHGTMDGYNAMVHVDPGKRSVLQLTPTQPGRYPIGDPGIGIYGTLVVE